MGKVQGCLRKRLVLAEMVGLTNCYVFVSIQTDQYDVVANQDCSWMPTASKSIARSHRVLQGAYQTLVLERWSVSPHSFF